MVAFRCDGSGVQQLDPGLSSPTLFLPFIDLRNGERFDVNRRCGRQPSSPEDSNRRRKMQGGGVCGAGAGVPEYYINENARNGV